MNVQYARTRMPVTREYVYLDHAATGPLPEPVMKANQDFTAEKLYGDVFWESWENVAETTRRIIAELLHARMEEIALVPNTSEGLGIVGNGLSYNKGDNVVTSNLEFTSNLFVWQALCMRHGMEFRAVSAKAGSLKLADFQRTIDKRTKVVAISHVQFANGFKIDLAELCKIAHEKGAYVITDAVQSVGQMPVDIRQLDVDFLACSGYKWLLSPIATGFLYIRRDLIDSVYPLMPGYRSAERKDDYTFRIFKPAKGARRFEHGQLNFPGFAGMSEAIRFLKSFGINRIQRRIQKLTDQIIEGTLEIPSITLASSIEPLHRSGILNIRCKSPMIAEKKLRKKGIVISVRAAGLRISPHFYNSEHEIDFLLDNMKRL